MVHPRGPHQQRTGVAVFSAVPLDCLRGPRGMGRRRAGAGFRFLAAADRLSAGMPVRLLPIGILPPAVTKTPVA
jgi:hypothetical protein